MLGERRSAQAVLEEYVAGCQLFLFAFTTMLPGGDFESFIDKRAMSLNPGRPVPVVRNFPLPDTLRIPNTRDVVVIIVPISIVVGFWSMMIESFNWKGGSATPCDEDELQRKTIKAGPPFRSQATAQKVKSSPWLSADIFFRWRIDLDSFPSPLPPVVFMATENDGSFPYNAGVMLMHLPALRTTYDAFLTFILGNERGLRFGLYGPVDQGAYNQFYETDIWPWRLPQAFNARPYHEANPDAYIVHFNGAKPHDFARYFATGRCPFGQLPGLCLMSVQSGYCDYMEEWARHYQPGDSLDPGLPPTCSLELQILRKLGRNVSWS